jgi:hypothetical protein
MKGVILGITTHDYKSQLKQNDLVSIDGHFYNLELIDPRFMKRDDDIDNPYMYFIKEPISGELMNFKRSEISKANIAVFDFDKYYDKNIKIMIGNLNPEDLRNIKAKHALDWDVPTQKIDEITLADILELSFNGEIISKEISSPYPDDILVKSSTLLYFKLL